MFRFTLLLSTAILFTGCMSRRAEQPPPGWQGAPPAPNGMVVPAPAPSGCNSCGGQASVIAAPRYTPPMPASPPLTSNVVTPPQVVVLGSPVASAKQPGPLQVAFKPSLPPIETAKLGVLEVEAEATTVLPVPPVENVEGKISGSTN